MQQAQIVFSPRGEALPLIIFQIKSVRKRVDVAMAFLSHDDLLGALCFIAHKKGVIVRLVVDSEMAKDAQKKMLDRLAWCGVNVYVITVPNGKMHMKVAVVDDDIVISGAANWTKQAFESNVEDTVVVRSVELARRYRAKMDELVVQSERHEATDERPKDLIKSLVWPTPAAFRTAEKGVLAAPRSRVFSPPRLRWPSGAESALLDTWFTPDDDTVSSLIASIQSATNRVDVGMYMMNEPSVIQALARQAATCSVRVLADKEMRAPAFVKHLHLLAEAGCEVRIFGKDRENLHLKTLVVDDREIWTGSANWTVNALSRNVEDMLCFRDGAMAAYYRAYLDSVVPYCESFGKEQGIIPIPTPQPGSPEAMLPETGPRSDYDHLDRPRFSAFEVNAYARYLPDETYFPVLINLIRSARQTIFINMYVMSEQEGAAPCRDAIVKELSSAAQRGVYVRLQLYMPDSPKDRLNEIHSAWAERLRAHGIDVRLAIPNYPLHEKLVVVDLARVLIGSHNWSEGALDGSRVHESSLLLAQTAQDERWADYVFSRHVVSDMRAPQLWKEEIENLRRITGMSSKDRHVFVQEHSNNGANDATKAPAPESVITPSPEMDRMALRTGETIFGEVMHVSPDRYQWREASGAVRIIPRKKAMHVFYGNAARAERDLNLGANPSLTGTSAPIPAQILPTDSFGTNLLAGLREATNSIHMLAYNLSEAPYSPITDIYKTLREKARSGIEVVLIVEYGTGTSSFLKDRVLNFTRTLATDGIQVLFCQERKVQHKKMVVVDGRVLWLGSSNLTLAGMTTSSEVNVRLDHPFLATQAEADFSRMRQNAKTYEQLK